MHVVAIPYSSGHSLQRSVLKRDVSFDCIVAIPYSSGHSLQRKKVLWGITNKGGESQSLIHQVILSNESWRCKDQPQKFVAIPYSSGHSLQQ